jgi:hypothetical protein
MKYSRTSDSEKKSLKVKSFNFYKDVFLKISREISPTWRIRFVRQWRIFYGAGRRRHDEYVCGAWRHIGSTFWKPGCT